MNFTKRVLILSLLSAAQAKAQTPGNPLDCTGQITILNTSDPKGTSDTVFGPYKIFTPGKLSFLAEVSTSGMSETCAKVASDWGMKPFPASQLLFQQKVSDGSAEWAAAVASDALNAVIPFQLEWAPSIYEAVPGLFQVPQITIKGGLASENTFGGGMLAIQSSQAIVISVNHPPKEVSLLSDEEKLADAKLLFKSFDIKELQGATVDLLTKQLMPVALQSKSEFYKLIDTAMLEVGKSSSRNFFKFDVGGSHGAAYASAIVDIIKDGLSTSVDEKASLLLKYPYLLVTRKCLPVDSELLKVVLQKASEFDGEIWVGHKQNLIEALKKLSSPLNCNKGAYNKETKKLTESVILKLSKKD